MSTLNLFYSSAGRYTGSYRKPVYTLKCWVVLTQLWVKYGQTQTLG